jgi:hypothetical protein
MGYIQVQFQDTNLGVLADFEPQNLRSSMPIEKSGLVLRTSVHIYEDDHNRNFEYQLINILL